MPGGAPVGNTNARNGKQWKQAIERALDRRGNGDRAAALDALAERLLKKIDEGDVSAIREFGDRMDGKPAQSIDMIAELTTRKAFDVSDDELAAIAANASRSNPT